VEVNDPALSEPFYLSRGGFFYRLMLRTRLVEENRYHEWRRIAVFLSLTWLPLFILSAHAGALAGGNTQLPFLLDPGPYGKYLFALPMIVVADRIIDRLLVAVVQYFETSGLLPDEARARFRGALLELSRRRDSVWAEVTLIFLALILSLSVLLGFSDMSVGKDVSSWAWRITGESKRVTIAGWWYLLGSAPILQFLIYRWFWRFVIWVGFLYRVSRIRLAFQPTHSDLAGGLGILGSAQNAFGILFVAVGAMMSSVLAHDILLEGRKWIDVQPEVVIFVVSSVAVIVAPLFLFSGQLFRAKGRALQDYGVLQYELSEDFNGNWMVDQGKDLVNSAQPSAMADFNAVYETVREMRIVPIKPKGTIILALVLVTPFLPLVFTQISMREALQRLIQTFV
jgi:hypothetical protein